MKEASVTIIHLGNVSEKKLRKALQKRHAWSPPLPPFGRERLRALEKLYRSSNLSNEDKEQILNEITKLNPLVQAKIRLREEIKELKKKIAEFQSEGNEIKAQGLEHELAWKIDHYFSHPADQLRHDYIKRWNGDPIYASLELLQKIVECEFITFEELELIPHTIIVYDRKTKTKKKVQPFSNWLRWCYKTNDQGDVIEEGFEIRVNKIREAKVFKKQMYYRAFGR